MATGRYAHCRCRTSFKLTARTGDAARSPSRLKLEVSAYGRGDPPSCCASNCHLTAKNPVTSARATWHTACKATLYNAPRVPADALAPRVWTERGTPTRAHGETSCRHCMEPRRDKSPGDSTACGVKAAAEGSSVRRDSPPPPSPNTAFARVSHVRPQPTLGTGDAPQDVSVP